MSSEGEYQGSAWLASLLVVVCICGYNLVRILMIRSTEGYSWHSNQYGLAIDNVVAYELVMPNGNVTNVTASSDPDLFFSLKVRCLRPAFFYP